MKIVVGTRKAQAPLVESRAVARLLERAGAEVEIRAIQTVGDELDVAPAMHGGGAFVREIDEALLRGDVDVAVHDAKDIAADLPRGIAIAAIPQRDEAREAFVSTKARRLTALPKGARMGALGPCRTAQLARLRPDLELVPVSGDIESRLRALKAGDVDALILAAAGLVRMGVGKVITELIPTDRMIPAVGQGALAVEVRSADRDLMQFLRKACHHRASGFRIRAERAFQKAVGAAAGIAFAAHAEIRPSGISVVGFVSLPDGSSFFSDRVEGAIEESAELGKKIGEKLLKKFG
jgi:hydroxymethylbilane synthase